LGWNLVSSAAARAFQGRGCSLRPGRSSCGRFRRSCFTSIRVDRRHQYAQRMTKSFLPSLLEPTLPFVTACYRFGACYRLPCYRFCPRNGCLLLVCVWKFHTVTSLLPVHGHCKGMHAMDEETCDASLARRLGPILANYPRQCGTGGEAPAHL